MRMLARVLLMVAVTAWIASAQGDPKLGQEFYNSSCRSCHGADGTPNPAVVKLMKVEMKPLSDPEVQAMDDGKWTEIIKNGMGKMKPVTKLNDKQIESVIAFARTLKK
jgi:mono/diheme cytochrome c family protein